MPGMTVTQAALLSPALLLTAVLLAEKQTAAPVRDLTLAPPPTPVNERGKKTCSQRRNRRRGGSRSWIA
jgi:hypothetical protein